MPMIHRRSAAAALAAAALALGVSSARSTPARAAEDEVASPERVMALVPEIRALIEKTQPAFGIPGIAVGLVNSQGALWSSGFGRRRIDRPEAPDPDTLFEIGSATKQMLAATLAMAVGEGKLDWDDRVADRIPGFRLPEAWVTQEFRISDLLRQWSGLMPYGMDFVWALGGAPDAMLRAVGDSPWTGGFRSKFQYVNTLHVLTGAMLARIYGTKDWAELVEQRIFKPLGMSRTTARASAWRADPNVGTPHSWQDGKAIPIGPITDEAAGAGAVRSSVVEIQRWLAFQLGVGTVLGRELIPADALIMTRTPAVAVDATNSYAMGLLVTRTPRGNAIWHNGGTDGSNSHIGFLEGHDVGVVILSNLAPRGLPDALAMWIYHRLLGAELPEKVARALAGPAPDKPKPQPPSAPLGRPASAYEGRYDQAFLGPAELRAEGEGLRLRFLERHFAIRLRPVGGDVFAASLLVDPPVPGEFPELMTAMAQFEPEPDGAEPAIIRLLDPQNPMRFVRAKPRE